MPGIVSIYNLIVWEMGKGELGLCLLDPFFSNLLFLSFFIVFGVGGGSCVTAPMGDWRTT